MQVADRPIADAAAEPGGRVPMWAGVLVGVVSLAAGLAVSDLIAALRNGAASPVVEVGNRVVDLVPVGLREWAIATFGTSDKAVLLAGVVVVLVAVAAVAGVWMVRGRRGPALALLAGVLAVGAMAPLGRGGAGWGSVAATVLGGAAGVAVLWFLAGRAGALAGNDPAPAPAPAAAPAPAPAPQVLPRFRRAMRDTTGAELASGPDPASEPASDPTRPVQPMPPARPKGAASRRGFLAIAAGVGVAAAAAGGLASWLRSQAAVTTERLGVTLPKAARPLPPVPPGVSVGVEGVSPFITPVDDFYRIDTALVPPKVSIDGWSLRVHGRVRRELSLTYEELLARPMIEVDATIACVSNVVGGDLVGTARWLGCRLDDLLGEAGIDPRADQVVGRSVDDFTAGFPTAVLDGRDAIVAVGMNGEPLTTDHGYPARLIVPGLYGYVSATKWLSGIELTRFDEFEGYWIPRGWDVEAPIVAASRIDTPARGSAVPAGRPLAVGGVAWAPVQGIAGVELQLDDGPWEPAELGQAHAGTTWRQWKHVVTPSAGDHRIRVRATDTDGETQAEEVVAPGPGPATGWHTIRVTAS